MSQVKVWNDSDHDYFEHFKGRDVVIRSKDYVTMPRAEAVTFQGTYTPARRDGVGRALNEKRIRLEYDLEAEASRKDQPVIKKCDVTKKEFRTWQGWENHQAELHSQPEAPEVTNVSKNTRGKPTGKRKQPIL
jgi:hypothetical protein